VVLCARPLCSAQQQQRFEETGEVEVDAAAAAAADVVLEEVCGGAAPRAAIAGVVLGIRTREGGRMIGFLRGD